LFAVLFACFACPWERSIYFHIIRCEA
jgi:hypothetical protein